MNKYNILILLFSFTIFSAAFAQEKPVQLKVLSYNLRFGELASMEEFAEFIKKIDPDLVALQEVDVHTNRKKAPKQNGVDFITELGYHTGMLTAYGKTIPYKGGYYGIGILSKYPLANVERIYLPKTEQGKEQRAILVAEVEYSEGEFITFASTHLDYTTSEERQIQVKKLNEVLMNRDYPVIVAGDFNARPNSTEISKGMSSWKQLCNMDKTSTPSNPKNKIDYIFGYPQEAWLLIENASYPVPLSDHLPISAVVEMVK